jgi:hypothetical protein
MPSMRPFPALGSTEFSRYGEGLEPATAGPGSLEEPPPAEPIDPEPAIADVGTPEEPPPAGPIDPEPVIAEPPTTQQDRR